MFRLLDQFISYINLPSPCSNILSILKATIFLEVETNWSIAAT